MERKCTENELCEGEEEEEEEALSLCDLPINEENHHHQSRKEDQVPVPIPIPIPRTNEIQEEFDFCSFSKESEMCAADEVFYQGQILPLRNSVSSEKGLNGDRSDSRCISRCASMDHCYSVGFTSVSSRSSSIGSHQSSSSTGSSRSIRSNNIPNPRVRNQFHSHPSPTPQLRLSSIKQGNLRNSNRKSSLWSIFHVGLVTPPEIALQDLKTRRENKNFGSRNSTSSNSSDFSNVSNKKNRSRFFDKNGVLFGGCKCSANAVETVSPRVVFIKRSASENELQLRESNIQTKNSTKNQQQQQQHRTRKQALSRHRTFEWLKQLSLESATDETLLPM